ncbi:Proteasome maturation factor UMP1 [Theobroma cacao]|uniref:Proteasome maturation factor UMP1 n=1 Tax=Theobroma cacao TaxID=3641 RepID=A0A061EI09_THECC|nr:Proteasome maturation factor UMP1 [Theobroma cacao]
MEAPKTIQHEIGGLQNDALRFGLHGVKSDLVGSHPLQSAYESAKKTQEEMRRKVLANTYGTALPLKMDLDRQILSRVYTHTDTHTISAASDYLVLFYFGTLTEGSYGLCGEWEVVVWKEKTICMNEALLFFRGLHHRSASKTLIGYKGRWRLLRFQRPLLPSSMLGLEALTGTLDDFGFEDYLNDPRESETVRPLDLHHNMEVHLGLSKGPVCPSFI